MNVIKYSSQTTSTNDLSFFEFFRGEVTHVSTFFHVDFPDLPDSGYIDTWPETGDAPPAWRKPALRNRFQKRRDRRQRSTLRSTLPCRMKESSRPGGS